MYLIQMVVGDWANDGHGQTETLVIESNLSRGEIEKAYKKGVKDFGLDVSAELCCGYENGSVSREVYKRFEMIDPDFADKYAENVDDGEGEEIGIWHREFTAMWLMVAQCGNPDLTWKFSDAVETINIRGYGLFNA